MQALNVKRQKSPAAPRHRSSGVAPPRGGLSPKSSGKLLIGGRSSREDSTLPDLDQIFIKIYEEFSVLRTCGLSRNDLLQYLKLK